MRKSNICSKKVRIKVSVLRIKLTQLNCGMLDKLDKLVVLIKLVKIINRINRTAICQSY